MGKIKFFIGKEITTEGGEVVEKGDFSIPADLLLTHALVIGATGSGKTVVCKAIIEEALLNDVPVIAVDPKGDISALGMVFEKLEPEFVVPLVENEARDLEVDADELAHDTIALYRENLSKSYGEVSVYERNLEQLAAKLRVLVVAPRQGAGVEVSSLPEFEIVDRQNAEIVDLKVRILLEQAGYENVKATDNKAMFLVHLLDHFWEVDGYKTVTLQTLIRGVMDPPIEKVGMIPIDKFISKKIREDVARNLNSLMLKAKRGVPLNIAKLLELARTSPKEGEDAAVLPDPKKVVPLVVFDLRGITNEKDKQSFVAQALGAVHRWIWEKGGTSRLRALLYFDELFGFMPPVRKTPSKQILLLLLKQARSFGLGLVLATQNPGDLDYRGLGNIGTWFVGRLAAKTDIQKVSRGLRSVLEAQGKVEDEIRDVLNKIQGLKPGQFLFQNAKMGVRRLKSRWLLTYHKGPLVPAEIRLVSVVPPLPEDEVEVDGPAGGEVEGAPTSGTGEAPVDRELEKFEKYFVDLGEVRPEFEGFAEKYLPVKVKPKPKGLLRVLAHRLGLPRDMAGAGLEVEFSRVVAYYSPMLVFPIEVLIESDVEYKDVLVPIELSYKYTRAVDLRYELDWEADVSEDVHPASFPTKQLKIVPNPAVGSYLTLKGVEPEKLEENLRWYLTKNAYDGTDTLLRQAIFNA
ncbi:MAG: ATP-binding protein, partial [Promethearchaeota archaeon]